MTTRSPMTPSASERRGFATLWVVVAPLFAYSALESMLGPALPDIQHAVSASTSAIGWVFTGLLLSAAVATPLVGRIADIRDKRTTLMAVLLIVAVGTLLGGLARNVAVLTVGQVLQGFGLSLIPLSVGLIRDSQPARRVAASNGLIVGTAAAGSAVGLVVVGPLMEVLSYRWLYWIALAVFLVSLVVAWATMPSYPPKQRGKVDIPGAFLLAVGLVAMLIGITRSSTNGWGSPLVISLIAIGVALLGVFAAVELRVTDPIVDVRLLSQRAVVITCFVALAVGFGTFTVFVLIPLWVATPTSTGYGLGGGAMAAGLYLAPVGVVGAAIAPLAGRLQRAVGARGVMLAGTVPMVLAALLLLASQGRSWLIVVAMVLAGVMVGLALTAAMNIVIATMPEERTSSVSGLAFVVRNVGGALGSQVSAVLVAQSASAATGVPAWHGYQAAFWVMAVVTAVSAALACALPARAPRTVAAPAIRESL
jgi:MFS family permease